MLDTRDETQRVVEAFNRMVQELEKRQDQLVQAKKLSSLGVLTSGVAHQLNNPLNNISTSCQILMEEMKDLKTADLAFFQKMLSNIDQEVDRARDIVKGLLEFARAKEFTLKPTPLKAVVDRTLRLISSQVPADVEITEEVPEDLVLELDAQRMQEALLNLIMNGIQAIDGKPGQIKVEARVDRGHATGHHCRGGHGGRDIQAGPGADFRPVFHHQGCGRHGSGAVHRLRHRP